jgi:hypothetical protein
MLSRLRPSRKCRSYDRIWTVQQMPSRGSGSRRCLPFNRLQSATIRRSMGRTSAILPFDTRPVREKTMVDRVGGIDVRSL